MTADTSPETVVVDGGATGRPPASAAEPSGWYARVRGPLAVAAGAGVGAAALLLHDPHQRGSWGLCPLHVVTGLYCPACGALRGTAELLHGNLAAAWEDNPFWVVTVPVLVVVWVLWLVRRWRGRPVLAVPQRLLWLALGLVVLFGVVRNLPWFPLVPA